CERYLPNLPTQLFDWVSLDSRLGTLPYLANSTPRVLGRSLRGLVKRKPLALRCCRIRQFSFWDQASADQLFLLRQDQVGYRFFEVLARCVELVSFFVLRPRRVPEQV